MQQFLVDGYVLVRADFAEPVHQRIYERVEQVLASEGNLGNNMIPRVPEVQRVLEHPHVRGALISLLGPDYALNPHRFTHLNPPGSPGQNWHKDCYVYDHNIRHPRFRWVMGFYYPQDVDETMGPTGLLPGVQDYASITDPRPDHTRETALPLCGPAGTVAFVHFDSWHRATQNVSDRKRYMWKFQFTRLAEPEGPTWDHRSAEWEVPVEDARRAMLHDVWDWLRGAGGASIGSIRPADVGAAWEALAEGSEPARMQAAYELGLGVGSAGPGLLEALRRQARAVEPTIQARTPDNAHGTNPTALPAAQGLVAAGPAAIPWLTAALADEHWLTRAAAADALGSQGLAAGEAADALAGALTDEHWWVRRNACEALGRIGKAARGHAQGVSTCLSDEDYRVRRMAAVAVGQLGIPSPDTVPALGRMLVEENRYNRHYAALALRRLPGLEARDVLMDFLFTARWCEITTRETLY